MGPYNKAASLLTNRSKTYSQSTEGLFHDSPALGKKIFSTHNFEKMTVPVWCDVYVNSGQVIEVDRMPGFRFHS